MKLFSKKNFCAGFTLIELLVIIAIVGVMAGAVVVAVNPLSKLNSAKLANVKTFSASVENALIMSQVGKWSFDDSEIPGKDTSGYGNDGTLVGAGATWKNSSECGLGFGGCMSFDGNSYIVIPASSSLNFSGSAMTIEMWVKPTSANTYGSAWRALAGQRADCGGSFNWQLYAYERTTGYSIFTLGDGQRSAKNSSVLPFDVWSHIAGTYDGATIRLYVNGVEADNTPETGTIHSNSLITNIGYESCSTNKFYGLIDGVRIYKSALLSYQIQQLYAQGLVKHLLALK